MKHLPYQCTVFVDLRYQYTESRPNIKTVKNMLHEETLNLKKHDFRFHSFLEKRRSS